jgi:hypothetical protein
MKIINTIKNIYADPVLYLSPKIGYTIEKSHIKYEANSKNDSSIVYRMFNSNELYGLYLAIITNFVKKNKILNIN